MARRVDLAREHLSKRVEAADARRADPEDRVNVIVVLQLAQLQGVRRVNEDNDLVEVLLGVGQDLPLVRRQHEAVGVLIGRDLLAAVVIIRAGELVLLALAALAGHDKDRGVVVQGERVLIQSELLGCEIMVNEADGRLLSIRGGRARLSIGVEDGGIHVDACVFKALPERDELLERGHGLCPGALRAVARIRGRDAEAGHVRLGGAEGQRIVPVFQQDEALAGDLFIEAHGGVLLVLEAGKRRVVMSCGRQVVDQSSVFRLVRGIA